jgi:hypothetical protein
MVSLSPMGTSGRAAIVPSCAQSRFPSSLIFFSGRLSIRISSTGRFLQRRYQRTGADDLMEFPRIPGRI